MKVLVAAICDHAFVEHGCLTVIRAFDTIHAPQFPFNMSRLSVGIRLLIGRSEQPTHQLNLSIIDSDGKKLLNSDAQIKAPSMSADIPELTFSFALNGQNIKFPHAGNYQLTLTINGTIQATAPIYVRPKDKRP